MKKLIVILATFFFLVSCEKENIELRLPYLGEWTTYLPSNEQRTDSLNLRICFSILTSANVYYTYRLYDFDLNYNDSTISYKVFYPNPNFTIKYRGKYNERDDIFMGNSYYYVNSKDTAYFLYVHENILTTRGMTLFD